MLFRQLFDEVSHTYTYLLADETSKDAIMIDAVMQQVDRDAQLIKELGLTLRYVLDTHVHADHITASATLRDRLGAETVVSSATPMACADHQVAEDEQLHFGQYQVNILNTPGHTDSCLTYTVEDGDQVYAFTGDAILIRGCGRTDFQQGSAKKLYHSVHEKIYTLPDHTFIFPGHDYRGFRQTTVAEEKQFNPRLRLAIGESEFIEIMANLQLAMPEQIASAVPANLQCGRSDLTKQMA